MANHINHYKSLKKKHKIKKRGNSNLPFNFVRIIFCSLFFIFLLLVFLQWFHFLLSSSSFLGLWCCLLLLPSFEFHTKTIFFPISFIFHFCPDIFSTDLYVCYIFIHISPFAVAISFMRCFHFFVVFSFSFSVCVQWILFIRLTIVRMVTREFTLFMSWVCSKHLNCTVLK